MLDAAAIRKLAEDAIDKCAASPARRWEIIEAAICAALKAARVERDATLAELRVEVEDGTRALASYPCDGTAACPCEPGNRCIPCKCSAVLGADAPARRLPAPVAPPPDVELIAALQHIWDTDHALTCGCACDTIAADAITAYRSRTASAPDVEARVPCSVCGKPSLWPKAFRVYCGSSCADKDSEGTWRAP